MSARRVPVPDHEPLLRERYDYADAFAITVPAEDPRTAEEFARSTMANAHPVVRWIVHNAHRHVLRLRSGPVDSPKHLIGWEIVVSERDVFQMSAESSLMRGTIVGRRLTPTHVVVTTYVVFKQPALAGAIWKAVGPVHRVVAPYLLAQGAAASPCPS